MTVSNIVGPLMIYSDRFLVGAIVSVMAVAYYATPYEVVNKLLIVPAAVAGVLFPAFSTAYSCDHNRMVKLFERGCRCVLLILFPVTLIVVTFAHEILNVWLGPAFARNSTTVLQLLAVGILINSLGQIPFTLLQGVGRPDLTAKLHLLELSLYLPAVWWATTRYGIQGTAAVWLLRATLDAVVLFAWVQRYVAASPRSMAKIGLFTSCGLPILAVGLFPFGLLFKAVFVSASLLLFLLASWFWVLTSQERVVVQGYIGGLQIVEPG
jgi:O-antigen/teichoic acid export membrane protein